MADSRKPLLVRVDYPFGYAATGKGRNREAGPIEAEQKAMSRIVELRPRWPLLP
jgi:hypothetical protein